MTVTSRLRGQVALHHSVFAVIVGRTTYDLSIPYWGADGPLGAARVPTVVISHSVPQDLPDGNVYSFVNEIEVIQTPEVIHLRFCVVK